MLTMLPKLPEEEKRKTYSASSQIHLDPDLAIQGQVVKQLNVTFQNYRKKREAPQ